MNSDLSLQFVQVLNGTFAVGHRPKIKTLPVYKQRGVSHVITLLSIKEGALEIKKAVISNELEWLWLPLENAKTPAPDKTDEILDMFLKWKALLHEKANLYLHCSAGIHRTGMIAYAFMRYLGFNAAEAITRLEKMRAITAEQMGYHRLAWGDEFAVNTNKASFDTRLDEFLQNNYVGCVFYSHSIGGGYQYRGKIAKVHEDGSVSLCHVETTSNEDYDDNFTDPFSIEGTWQPYMDFVYKSTDLYIVHHPNGVVISYSHAGVLYIHQKPYKPAKTL